jgi:DNA polymerase I-like protein with 3'-5' exonuclease and polymerase domains
VFETIFPQFKRVTVPDTEFQTEPPGNRPAPVSITARELRGNREWQQFRGEFGSKPPFPVDDDTVFVGYYVSAEIGFFKALGWPEPRHWVDLYIEFRNLTNGLWLPHGAGVVGAMSYFNLDYPADKGEMINLINRGNWSADEVRKILHYNWVDVDSTARLLVAMYPRLDIDRALYRGTFPPVAAAMEWNGLPIDVETFERLRYHWENLQDRLIARLDRKYKIYEGRTFKEKRWGETMDKLGIPWPRLDSGRLDLEDDTFRQMAKVYPAIVGPYRELRYALSQTRLFENLAIGSDGRNRTLTSYYRARTSRSQPSNSKGLMGTSVALRNLITPRRGRVIISADYSQQEPGIGAALAPDERMKRAYDVGDFYLGFAIEAKTATPPQVRRYLERKQRRKSQDVPLEAADKAMDELRERYKPVVLGIIYDRTAWGLARALGLQPIEALRPIEQFYQAFPDCWEWSTRRLDYALAHRLTGTVMGWQLHLPDDSIEEDATGRVFIRSPNARAIRNFAFQANAAEMTRLGARLAWERGENVLLTLHDQIMSEAAWEDRSRASAVLEECMIEASRIILDGFALRVDTKIIAYPEHYTDSRGDTMWRVLMALLKAIEREKAA